LLVSEQLNWDRPLTADHVYKINCLL